MLSRRNFIGAVSALAIAPPLLERSGRRRWAFLRPRRLDPSIARFRQLFIEHLGIDDFRVRLIDEAGREIRCRGYRPLPLDFRGARWEDESRTSLRFPTVRFVNMGPGTSTGAALRRRDGTLWTLRPFSRPIHFHPTDLIKLEPALFVH